MRWQNDLNPLPHNRCPPFLLSRRSKEAPRPLPSTIFKKSIASLLDLLVYFFANPPFFLLRNKP